MNRDIRRRLILLAVGIVGFASALFAQTAPSYPLRLSGSGTYLVDQTNQPFFINGDSAWSLIVGLSKEDADIYLENRRQKGYNAIIAELIEHKFSANPPANFYGDSPFFTPGDFNTPNEAYFAHADWVVQDAAAKGQVVLLAPLYLGYACGDEGWCAEVMNSSLATMRSWGRYVGTRYRAFPNIIWVIGGDVDPASAGVADKVEEFVAGLKETDPTHLVTAHNVRGESAVAPWPNATWIDLNDIYTDSVTYTQSAAEYARVPPRPLFLIESYYENEQSSTPLSLRSQAYWALLSGAVSGHMFGNCPIWNFGFAVEFCTGTGLTWQSQLDSTAATTVARAGALFRSRPFFDLVPDLGHQVLISGYRSGTTLATTARTSSGSTVIAYLPTRRTVTIDMTKISGTSATGWWYDPRSGSASLIGTFATVGTRTFLPPTSADWVLVLDDSSLNLPAPGQSQQSPDTTPPSVSITAPAINATVSNIISVSADASDNVAVAGVQFKIDGNNLGTEDTSAPYVMNWNTATVANGSHTIVAVARDSSNNTMTSAPVTVTVNNVVLQPPLNTALPTVSGSTEQTGTLTGTNGTWTNNPSLFAYQWQRCDAVGSNCIAIAGANASTYVLSANDVGATMRVQVTATNASGSTAATSDKTARVTGLITFTVETAADDGDVTLSGPIDGGYPPSGSPAPYVTGTTLTAGRRNAFGSYEVNTALIRFNTASLPDNAAITSAILSIWVNVKADADNRNLVGEWYSGTNWPIDAADWSLNSMANAISGTDITAIAEGAVNNFSLAAADINVSKTGYTGLRLHVDGGLPAGDNYVQVASFESSGVQKPQLVVRYSLP